MPDELIVFLIGVAFFIIAAAVSYIRDRRDLRRWKMEDSDVNK